MGGYKDRPLHQTAESKPMSKSEANRVNAFWDLARYRTRERFKKSAVNWACVIAAGCAFGWVVAMVAK